MNSQGDKLQIDYTLPIINIPTKKVIPFLEWFDKDIFEGNDKGGIKEVPKIYDEGYITVTHIPHHIDEKDLSNFIKAEAKKAKATYRVVESQVMECYNSLFNNIIIYYKFIDDRLPDLEIYGDDGNTLLSLLPVSKRLNSSKEGVHLGNYYLIENGELQIKTDVDVSIENGYIVQKHLLDYYFELVVSAFWYMTLYKNRYKYESTLSSREEIQSVLYSNYKQPKHINNRRELKTSFCDLGKAPNSRVDTLIKKRAGFEYSHAFDVRGHYRHYKSGKVVYINSYVKAKDKPRIQQYIVLNPKK